MQYNTMRFGAGTFTLTTKKALFIAKEPFTTNTDFNYIDKFIVDAILPAGSEVRFAFYQPEYLAGEHRKRMFRLNQSAGTFGSLIGASGWSFEPNVDEVLQHGNTVDELNAIKAMSTDGEFVATLRPVIALAASGSDYPRVKITLVTQKRDDTFDHEIIRTHTFSEPRRILDIDFSSTVVGTGSATVDVAYKTEPNGDYTDFLAPYVVIRRTPIVYGHKIRTRMHVDKLGDSAKIGRMTIVSTPDVDCKTFDRFSDYADIYSVTRNLHLPLKYCSVIVKHNDLGTDDAKIKAYVSTAPNRYTSSNRTLGNTSGGADTFTLPTSKYFDPSGLSVYVNGSKTKNYAFSTKDNTITLCKADGTAAFPAGAAVTADYVYNYQEEDWIELTAGKTQYDISDGKFVTRFYAPITSSTDYVAAIRLRLFKGSSTLKSLTYTASGEEQSYKLAQGVNPFNVEGATSWEFDDSTNILTFTAPANSTVAVDYYTVPVTPKVYSWTAGFCP